MRRATQVAVVAAALMAAAVVAPADGAPVVILEDQNSTAQFDFGSADGLYLWEVGDRNHMYQQWFWLRTGPDGGETSLDDLALVGGPFVSDSDSSGQNETVVVQYAGLGLTVELRFMLVGGAPGSGMTDLTETITIVNAGTGPVDLHFFQYTDFDLNGTEDGDTVEIVGGNTAIQTKGPWFVAETVATPMPSHYQVDEYQEGGGLLGSLEDGAPTTLNDNAGPLADLDAVWAFQWDETLAATGGTLIISKKKHIVPEPATLALMAGGLGLGLAVRRRGR